MQTMTSAYANKMLRSLEEDKAFWVNKEAASCTYVVAVNEEPVVPEYDYDSKESKIFVCVPLYVEEAAFGYVVFDVEVGILYDYSVFNWTRSISQNLNRVRKNITIEELNKRLEKLYVMDHLTGVYNRFGMDRYFTIVKEKCIDKQMFC